jgi:hypothetical protein
LNLLVVTVSCLRCIRFKKNFHRHFQVSCVLLCAIALAGINSPVLAVTLDGLDEMLMKQGDMLMKLGDMQMLCDGDHTKARMQVGEKLQGCNTTLSSLTQLVPLRQLE